MKISSAVRLNAVAIFSLAILVGIVFFCQMLIVDAVDKKISSCITLRSKLNEIRVMLYESDAAGDREIFSKIESMFRESETIAESLDGYLSLSRRQYHDVSIYLERINGILCEIKGSRSLYQGYGRSEHFSDLKVRLQSSLYDGVAVSLSTEQELSGLLLRIRIVIASVAIGSIAAAALAAFFLSVFFSRRIDGAVERLVRLSREISGGKIIPEVFLSADDEFAAVYDAMHDMALSLRRIYEELAKEESRLRRMGNELRETSVFLDKIVSNASAPIVVWGTDFTITMFNRAFERMTGYRAAEVVGKRLSILFSEENAAASFDKISRALDGEQWDSVEMSVRKKDGGIRIILWNSANIIDDDGVVSATVAQGQDITERMETLRALKESERRFRMLFSEMQLGFALHEIICNPEGRPIDYRFIEVNPSFERMTGHSSAEVVGRTVREVMPGTEQYWIDIYGVVALTGIPRNFENYAGEIGSYFEVVVYSPEINRFATVFSDITERKNSEEKIHSLNLELEKKVEDRTRRLESYAHELEAFSYSVSHDLRAPLRSIEGFGRALEEDFGSVIPAEGLGYLSRIRNASTKMAHLIDDLLTLSRITRADMDIVDFDISAMTYSVFEEIGAAQPRENVELTIVPGIWARGDERLVRIALMNLASNAWKFSFKREPAKITFYSRDEDGKKSFIMSDNGAGFDMRWYDKLFGAFQRLHSAQEFPGTGIGLAIVQRVVSKHGGMIRAEGEPDKGASFFFTLS
jgi:PAS domain S-box-containing protein